MIDIFLVVPAPSFFPQLLLSSILLYVFLPPHPAVSLCPSLPLTLLSSPRDGVPFLTPHHSRVASCHLFRRSKVQYSFVPMFRCDQPFPSRGSLSPVVAPSLIVPPCRLIAGGPDEAFHSLFETSTLSPEPTSSVRWPMYLVRCSMPPSGLVREVARWKDLHKKYWKPY